MEPNRHKNELIFQEEEIAEQQSSEVCSLSFSETVSTTTFNNDKRDDDDDDDGEEVKQRVKKSPVAKLAPRNRAVVGDFGPKRDRVVGKSPNSRTDQSPDKRNNAGRGGSVRLVQNKESGTYQAGRRGLKPDTNGRDPGESSGRRSRSPATNRSTMGRSPSSRRVNGSPGRAKRKFPGAVAVAVARRASGKAHQILMVNLGMRTAGYVIVLSWILDMQFH
ncbi:hypothetical protein GH714_017995 [Hevea brasiliensis]|uniref:Uncharacterized protein n=1 Tax=Hevea brasiliensis TaxID=3981 RepID=A0A6A6LQS4_HEVBR|nr:hypothetical protein GH714_017995 [Hevea brasiliensis]